MFDYSIDRESHEFHKWWDIIPAYSGTPAVGIPSDADVHTVHAEVCGQFELHHEDTQLSGPGDQDKHKPVWSVTEGSYKFEISDL